MAIEPLQQMAPLRGKRAAFVAACIVLAVMLLFVSAVAKTSRYHVNATPSRHFSTSVKVARALFHNWASVEAPAVLVQVSGLPEAPRIEPAPVAQPPSEVASASVLLFPSLRAPPVLL